MSVADRVLHIGLIGKSLGHSYSPEIHARLGMTYPYTLREVAPDALGNFLAACSFDGFNVTIPYKKDIIPYLSGMSAVARRLGSVNTVIKKEGGWYGENTDYDGFLYMVRRSGYDVNGKKAVVIGSGGVCPTVCAVLSDLGASVIAVLSHRDNTPLGRARHADADLLVNTSPVGMYPSNGSSPVPLDAFPHLSCVLDLIYNPFESALLADARERGLITECGISMLVAQAKRAAELFLDSSLPDSLCERVTRDMIVSRRNLILIGMPGAGKSHIGRLCGELLGRRFVDIDREIKEEAKKPIPRILSEDGEDAFRALESRIIARVCRESSLVIATGGGCVTRRENYRPMAQNGVIVALERALDALPTDGRPLSQQNALSDLYKARAPLYASFSDVVVENDADITDVAKRVVRAFTDFSDRKRT